MPRSALGGIGGAIAAAIALASPAVADAAKLCVNHAGCSGAGTNFTTIQGALGEAGARSGPDTILAGPGTYHGPFTDDAGNQVTFVGSGNTTVLDDPGTGDGRTTLTVNEPASSFSSFAVLVPAGSATGNTGIATAGRLDRVKVTDPSGTPGARGILSGASVDHAIVDLPAANTIGVQVGNRLRRSRITASFTGVSTIGGSPVVENSLIRLTGGGSFHAAISVGTFTVLSARQVTLIGPGDADSEGVRVAPFNFAAGSSAGATVSGAIIQGFGHALGSDGQSQTCDSGGGSFFDCPQESEITVSYSDFDPSHNIGGPDPPSKLTYGPGNLNVDPGFRNPAFGDYRLRRVSKVIDKSDPAAPLSGDATTDLSGAPRRSDGDRNGSAIVDMGAFEFPPGFGLKTLVTLDRGAKKIPGSGPLPVVVSNLNGFRVTGTLSGKTTDKIPVGHHKKRHVGLAAKTFSMLGHHKVTVLLGLPQRVVKYFKDKGKLTVDLVARVRDPAGGVRTVPKTISVKLK